MELVIAEDVKAQGDREMLKTVLENLLDNAWKFTSGQPGAKIEFGSSIVNGETTYFVRDNGAGFDMAFAENLFKPFSRLHGESEFPGLGIGLAIAYRIINRHGGRIWAGSGRGEGRDGVLYALKKVSSFEFGVSSFSFRVSSFVFGVASLSPKNLKPETRNPKLSTGSSHPHG